MIAGTLLVVLTRIFLPGILIEGQERKAVGRSAGGSGTVYCFRFPAGKGGIGKPLSLMTASS